MTSRTGTSAPADTGTSRPDDRSAGPFWGIWLTALAILAVLIAAVVRTLSQPGAHSHQMAGHGGSSGALLRLGAPTSFQQLLGRPLLTAWQLDSVAVGLAVLLGASYLSGVVRARRRGPWPWPRCLFFAAGLLVYLLATCGSIGVYDQALYSAHMVGHLACVMAAPALLVAGRPFELAVAAAPGRGRRRIEAALHSRVATFLTAPPVALASYAVVIVGTHLTGLMDSIMRNPWAGQVEHLVYLLVGIQFFVLVLGDAPLRWQLSTPARWLLLALSMAVDTFVGIVIMQGNTPVAMVAAPGLNVDPLSDTHTGGSIMWVGGDAIMAAIMIGLVLSWLGDPDRQRRDSAGWLEQARRAAFAERVGQPSMARGPQGQDGQNGLAGPHGPDGDEADLDFDSQGRQLAAYNAYLARLNADEPRR
jgi:putative copper resistance protein D